MTTIAACLASRTMAADSRITYQEHDVDGHSAPDTAINVYKLVRTRRWIIGCSGDEGDIQAFLRWVKAGKKTKRKKVSKEGSFEALMLSRTKLVHMVDDLEPIHIRDGYMAIGSGSSFALGAMTSCKILGGLHVDPIHAVQVACQHDPGSREPIDSMEWSL